MEEDLETSRDEGLSNTKESTPPSKKKQCNQLVHWFFTFNNYDPRDIETLETFFNVWCDKYVFQEEVGKKSGLPHLQGVISLKKKARWTEFGLNPAIHWEKPRNLTLCYFYCSKVETRTGRTCAKNFVIKKPLKLIKPDRDWQIEILNIVNSEPDDRKVYWYYSSEGNVGKSSFCKYLVAKHNCVFIDEGKKSDIMHTLMEADMERDNCIVVFDVPRDNGNNVSYKSIESIKNGMIYSSKYESKYKLFNPPHVIVFSNFPPDTSKLSEDRWVIKEIF